MSNMSTELPLTPSPLPTYQHHAQPIYVCTVSQKGSPLLFFFNNFVNNEPILITFGAQNLGIIGGTTKPDNGKR